MLLVLGSAEPKESRSISGKNQLYRPFVLFHPQIRLSFFLVFLDSNDPFSWSKSRRYRRKFTKPSLTTGRSIDDPYGPRVLLTLSPVRVRARFHRKKSQVQAGRGPGRCRFRDKLILNSVSPTGFPDSPCFPAFWSEGGRYERP